MRDSSSQAALQHYKNTCADKLVKIYQYSPHQTTRHPTERHLKQINARVTFFFKCYLKGLIYLVRLILSIHGLNGHCSVKNLDAIPSQKVASVI